FARMLKADVPLALTILADILLNPAFDEEEIEREKNVVLQEIGASRDAPDDMVFDLIQETAYPSQPLGRPILGTAESVNSFTRAGLQHFTAQHYRPDAIVVGATGAVEHGDVVALVSTHFGSMPAGAPSTVRQARYVGGDTRQTRDLEQAHLVIAFEGVSYHSKDIYTAQILANTLGGGMSSRLFQEVREARGLCYSIFSFASSYRDSGLFGIYAATAPDQLADLVTVTGEQFQRLVGDISQTEVARARAQVKAGLVMSLESTPARLEQIVRQVMVLGKVIPLGELITRVDAVDAGAVAKLGQRILTQSKMSIGAVGGLEKLADPARMAAAFADKNQAI
ncbi:MAG: M16 family metallopeptidase, partial [Alphaproteobacteria bacterium]